ncbi:hypothetical protein H2201_003738 [Coniosporium apollinis]|uniref:Sacsin/Nov domain-containing protein n=1 Tax=Coniosporium apollinis TaxID=61459 RepID=A0ABQ9NUG4_9PEZI|nr:hypothetical protein H2201_003738 [Coniosporium apollinis]
MAGSVDFARLREQTMGSGEDEAVTVNTRALIDKVLARYSGDWTTLRELIQNAADAAASKVTIKFETLPSLAIPAPSTTNEGEILKHRVLNHTIKRLVVSNDGQSFADPDWARLKRIAEGNPDETKIGAFGVGFYSVFADCENPFVVSGRQTMAFYWKGNGLFTRIGKLPDDHPTAETCFSLDYRSSSSPIPDLLSLCQFLSTSLTFIGLKSIDLWLDDINVFGLSKESSPSESVPIPPELNAKTQGNLMKILTVANQRAQIHGRWTNIIAWTRTTSTPSTYASAPDEPANSGVSLKNFFSRLTIGGTNSGASAKKAAMEREAAAQRAIAEDLAGTSQATIGLRMSTVDIRTMVSDAFSRELERATKKPPPKRTKIAILTAPYAGTTTMLSTVSGTTGSKAADIFSSVLPSKHGRVFIGFPTAQTTGFLCHISAPSVIPTVERESIDLNARFVRDWNLELLRTAGIACRIAYTAEMAELKQALERTMSASGNRKVTEADLASILPGATHVLRQYTSHESTPSTQVGKTIEEAFWKCSKQQSIDIISTRGILPSRQVRIVPEKLSFLGEIPVVPERVAEEVEGFIQKLYAQGLLATITVQDIRNELERRALDENELMEFLRWAGKKATTNELDSATIQELLNAAVATLGPDNTSSSEGQKPGTATTGGIIALRNIDSFLSGGRIPPELPIPPSTIPYRFTRNLLHAELTAFGWDELQIVPWLRFLLGVSEKKSVAVPLEQDMTASPIFSAQVLPAISRAWDALSQSSKSTVIELLSSRTVIPTKLGMRKPPESYFASVKVFNDLPVISGLHGVKEKFLSALGVRKTVELNVIFDRLAKRASTGDQTDDASHVELVRYFSSVRQEMPDKDHERLKNMAFLPAEERPGIPSRLYKPSEIFRPEIALRTLGLPILHWPGQWRPHSPEDKYLRFLGLRQHPTMPELVQLMVEAGKNRNQEIYNRALTYLIDRYQVNEYHKFDASQVKAAFLPVEGASTFASPSNCFTTDMASMVGRLQLRKDLHPHAQKFGVRSDPPLDYCINYLVQHPPSSHQAAKEYFGYFATKVGELNRALQDKIGDANVVPITKLVNLDERQSGTEKPTLGSIGKWGHRVMRYTTPRSCFLGDSTTWGSIFDFVDFGDNANAFLLTVGAKQEPSHVELARMVAQNPAKVLKTIQQDKYMELLRRLAENESALKADKSLWTELKNSSALLAYKETIPVSSKSLNEKESESDQFEDEESAVREWCLASAANISIIDRIEYFMLFRDNLLVAPQEETLEDFYKSLGTPSLSEMIRIEKRIGAVSKDQKEAQALRKLTIERVRLFLHEYQPQSVRHDAKWLDRNLVVQSVESISLNLSLKNAKGSYTQHRTALIAREAGTRRALLSVARSPDLYEVSQQLVAVLISRPKQHDALALETIMSNDLRRLRTKGYNVDRILRQKEYENRIAEQQRQAYEDEQRKEKQKEEEQKSLAQQAKKAGAVAAGAVAHRDPSSEYEDDVRNNVRPSPIATEKMPGAFGPDSPQPIQRKKGKDNMLKKWSRQLGFGEAEENGVGGTGGAGSVGGSPGPGKSLMGNDALEKNLKAAVEACRSYESKQLQSAPHTETVEETKGSYCDYNSRKDISYITSSDVTGINIYMNNGVASPGAFMSANSNSIDQFGFILLDLGSIFSMQAKAIHIFHDPNTATIAFNHGYSLFFNYAYFSQLHLSSFLGDDGSASAGEKKVGALGYWYMAMCHELAHNLVKEHNASHSFYAEMFAHTHVHRFMATAKQYDTVE